MKIMFFVFTTIFAILRLAWSLKQSFSDISLSEPVCATITDIHDWGSVMAICSFTCVIVYFQNVLRDSIRLEDTRLFNVSVGAIMVALLCCVVGLFLGHKADTASNSAINSFSIYIPWVDIVLSTALILVAIAFLHFGMHTWNLVLQHYPFDGDGEALKLRIRRYARK